MIGKVPEGWRVEILSEITDTVRNGVNLDQLDEGRIPISRIETISNGIIDFERVKYANEISDEQLEKYLIHYNDILFSHINSPAHVGKTAIYKNTKKIIHGANLLLIRIKNENPDYVHYFIKKIKEKNYFYTRCNKAVNQASIKQSEILKIPIPIPPLPQQEKIVKVLDLSSGLIEKQQEFIKKYDLFLKSKFIEMFGEFINEMKDSVTIKDACNFIDYRGKTPNKTENGIKLITAKNVRERHIQEEPKEYIGESSYEDWISRGVVKRNDVLFTTEAPLGNVAKVTTNDRFVIGQRLIALQPKVSLNQDYLVYCLSSIQIQQQINKRATGSTVKGIRSKELAKITIPIPPFPLQNKFAKIVEKIEQIKSQESQKLIQLQTLHASLMEKAFKGEIA